MQPSSSTEDDLLWDVPGESGRWCIEIQRIKSMTGEGGANRQCTRNENPSPNRGSVTHEGFGMAESEYEDLLEIVFVQSGSFTTMKSNQKNI